MILRRNLKGMLFVAVAAVWMGCSSSPTPPMVIEKDDEAPAENTQPANNAANTEKPPVKKFTGLAPFDPPTLAELDAKAKWEDQLVVDPLELLREHQAKDKPLATVEEALKIRNDSPRANAKIVSGLGRLPASDAEVNYEATMIRHAPGDVKSTNPLMQSSVIDFDIGQLIGFGLFSFDWNLNALAPSEAVKSWQTSADRLYDRVVMRDDLVWSDGQPITAHDVVFSFQTIMDPEVPIPAARTGTDELRWVQAYDDHTLVFFHKESLATNVWNLNFPIIPKHIYEKTLPQDKTLTTSDEHVRLELDPVCGGPYKIAKRVRDQEVVLQRREDWYTHMGKQVRAKPYYKEVRFKIIKDSNTALLALKGGDLDELQLRPQQWTTQTGGDDFYDRNTKSWGVEWGYAYFGWNADPKLAPFFMDKRVRTAMSYAFDHNEMLNTLWSGLYQPSNGVFHPTSWMAPKNPPQPFTQDLDKAEDLLDEAGWTDHDGDGIRDKEVHGKTVKFDFTIQCSELPESAAVCELLKNNLSQIGVSCHVKPTEFTVLQQNNLDHNFQAVLAGWSTGTDPSTTENIFGTGKNRNYVQYSNPEVDKLYARGLREFDRQKRAAIYGRIHELLYEDQPYTWLYFRNSFYGFSRNLRGVVYSSRGPYHYSPGFFSIWSPAQ